MFFEKTSAPGKFDRDLKSQDNATPEIVIRELIQNAIDATEGGRNACITFCINNIDISAELSMVDYTSHFIKAYRYQNKVADKGASYMAVPTHISSAIKKARRSKKVKCLFAIDRGNGIKGGVDTIVKGDHKKIERGSGGSKGEGHLTAFGASPLRTVVYATKTRVGDHRASEPASQRASEPASQRASEPASQRASEPASQRASEPVYSKNSQPSLIWLDLKIKIR